MSKQPQNKLLEFSMNIPEEGRTKNFRKFMETIFTDGEQVFVSPRLFGLGDMVAFMACSVDAEPIVNRKNHVYVSTEWLVKERPEDKQIILKIEESAKNSYEKQNGQTITTTD